MTLKDQFLNPDREFSPLPFWFWNDLITREGIQRQMQDFFEKGVYGYVLHPRMGLAKEIGYLTERYFELVKYAVDLAFKMGMKVVLYDEGMYPSGSAHGMVVKENPAYAARGIRLYPKGTKLSGAMRLIAENAEYAIIEDDTHGTIRGVHPGEDDGEPDAPMAANLLDENAMAAFIRLTHEAYYSALKEHFGKTIIGMFTDEPSPTGRNVPTDIRPWSIELDDMFEKRDLFALWTDVGEETHAIRRRYDALITARMVKSYYLPLKNWCESHGIALTGHPHDPDSIAAERFFTIPGQDVVWRWVAPEKGLNLFGRESTQAKCASSAARHMGSRLNSNECFGCCGKNGNLFDFTADDMKWYLDWLFVRGTNLIYPHAFFYSIATPLQLNERPPDVGPNNYFWPHYRLFADYIRRMCLMNTDGVHQARIAVLCSGTALPDALPAKLFERQIDFNYLEDEMLLASPFENGALHVKNQRYDTLAVADTTLLTDEIKAHFKGRIVFEKDIEGLCGYETVLLSPPSKDLRAAHFIRSGVSVFILTNEGESAYSGLLSLPVAGAAEKWDPWNGRVRAISLPYELTLNRRQALVFVVDPKGENALAEKENRGSAPVTFPLKWQLNGQPLMELTDWQYSSDYALFSGTLTYTVAFTLKQKPTSLILDLGDVREMAEVSLNNSPFTPLLLRPFEWDCACFAVAGENTLTVRVTNGNVPRFTGKPHSSGLLGPVAFYKKGV